MSDSDLATLKSHFPDTKVLRGGLIAHRYAVITEDDGYPVAGGSTPQIAIRRAVDTLRRGGSLPPTPTTPARDHQPRTGGRHAPHHD
ncbi:hypothetical protein J2T57_002633 [Natronocella acetinitrilica]|uniref:Uncharacterized protein n=1 Tax=Natronocella acetinitrilica TaxID=414046 RepID=A0AAE3KCV1_9GAMM|nr:hypothetical protein [Natronocella acetinitrilica]